ncbi:MAG: Rid family hydrolase, partial [Acidimicrobiales bacterium]
GVIVDGGIAAELTQAIANLAKLLGEHDHGLADVVKTTVFMIDMGEYASMNSAYAAGFGAHRPARSAIGVSALPLGASVEIEAWVYAPGR